MMIDDTLPTQHCLQQARPDAAGQAVQAAEQIIIIGSVGTLQHYLRWVHSPSVIEFNAEKVQCDVYIRDLRFDR